ncbi:hypothetical protein RBB79_20500 [Tunturiibacter empetritectus]|uniref:Thioredoxin domain-containing protein n=1 Tax=Tunturiibacter lichenicola TaxID=2051959 RepID=A0A852VGX4_9BACT|nr:hypothetical protein [Edaphobacter lichenicola]NYF92063.1 hypothetical protein [Edaphobacter lichenicola]
MFGSNRIGRALGTAAGIAVLLLFAIGSHAQATGSNPPKMQLPADQRAFDAARATVDPAERLAAMQLFLKNYPKSTRVSRAQGDIFDTLVKYFPQRTAEIDSQAKIEIKDAGKGFVRLFYETDVADTLAEANDTGVDLPRAEKLAKDASRKFNEADCDKDVLDNAKKYKYPAPSAAARHSRFTKGRANALAALAKVDMDEHKPEPAAALLDQAYALDPTVAEVNLLRGEQALDQHKDAEALEDLERAQLTGELKSPWREKMIELYRNSHGGSDQSFLADMDAQYARIFPDPFTPQPAKPTDGSRTALLELFTGSACDPCVSADLAVDALLKTYSRKQLVVLAFDQHIPDPDPLANPDSIARAKSYRVAFTPTSKLNGKPLWEGGGPRANAETSYNEAIKKIDADTTKPSGVNLQLTATRAPDGMIHASATVSIDNPQLLQQSLAPDPPAKEADAKTPAAIPAATATPPAPAAQPASIEPHLVANFALVEDDVRYSGENGIRFHRMVVRSLAQPAGTGSPVEAGKALEATFDPAAISATLKTYLDTYEQKNDRFGKVVFLAKDTTLEPAHLAIAAWVEDTTTHRVLQAAFVPLASTGSQIHQSQSEPPAQQSEAAAKTGAAK